MVIVADKVAPPQVQVEVKREIRMPAPPGKKLILILGAGFGGMAAAMELEARLRDREDIEVALVDRHPYHLFTPMLFQVAVGEVEPGHIAYPLRWLCRQKRVSFYEGEARYIDMANRRVMLDGVELPYEYLVLALGSVTNFFNVPKAEKLALPLKTLREAMSIKYRIVDVFRRAELEPDEAARRRLLSFAVVGGGASGVELAAALYDLLFTVMPKDHPRLYPGEVRLCLVEASKGLLAGLDSAMSNLALQRLKKKGVTVSLNTRVVGIEEEGIRTAEGTLIGATTVIWATGIRPNPLLEPLPMVKSKDGKAVVRDTLRIPLWPRVYAVGDCAYFVPPGAERPLPAKAAVAAQEGRAAAQNIVRSLAGEQQFPFRYQYEGDLVALGHNAALARLWGRTFDGFAAWSIWNLVHLWKLPGSQHQASVALDWITDFVMRRDTIRLE